MFLGSFALSPLIAPSIAAAASGALSIIFCPSDIPGTLKFRVINLKLVYDMHIIDAISVNTLLGIYALRFIIGFL
jgi:hypothetical protein